MSHGKSLLEYGAIVYFIMRQQEEATMRNLETSSAKWLQEDSQLMTQTQLAEAGASLVPRKCYTWHIFTLSRKAPSLLRTSTNTAFSLRF